MSSLVDREEMGRLGRFWSKLRRAWALVDAICCIVLGVLFAPAGLAAIVLAGSSLLNGLTDNAEIAGLGVLFFGGLAAFYIVGGIRDLKEWLRTR
jgi:hypothetical protein